MRQEKTLAGLAPALLVRCLLVVLEVSTTASPTDAKQPQSGVPTAVIREPGWHQMLLGVCSSRRQLRLQQDMRLLLLQRWATGRTQAFSRWLTMPAAAAAMKKQTRQLPGGRSRFHEYTLLGQPQLQRGQLWPGQKPQQPSQQQQWLLRNPPGFLCKESQPCQRHLAVWLGLVSAW